MWVQHHAGQTVDRDSRVQFLGPYEEVICSVICTDLDHSQPASLHSNVGLNIVAIAQNVSLKCVNTIFSIFSEAFDNGH